MGIEWQAALCLRLLPLVRMASWRRGIMGVRLANRYGTRGMPVGAP